MITIGVTAECVTNIAVCNVTVTSDICISMSMGCVVTSKIYLPNVRCFRDNSRIDHSSFDCKFITEKYNANN